MTLSTTRPADRSATVVASLTKEATEEFYRTLLRLFLSWAEDFEGFPGVLAGFSVAIPHAKTKGIDLQQPLMDELAHLPLAKNTDLALLALNPVTLGRIIHARPNIPGTQLSDDPIQTIQELAGASPKQLMEWSQVRYEDLGEILAHLQLFHEVALVVMDSVFAVH
jgi:hypothetical protein